PSEPAFRCSSRTLQRHATNFAQKTGIEFSCHVLRHTFATRLLERGISIEHIQKLLGHRTASMTRHYTQNAYTNFDDIAPKIMKEEFNETII
ncbi:site-specific integrase, partial [Acinetobacter baumannii]